MSPVGHRDQILDQFTRQAVPFSQAASIRNHTELNRLVQLAEATASDVSLDIACGPGLVVCAFARVVRHATGIDLTQAMLDQAKKLQREENLENVRWYHGDVVPLPFPDATFSIVTARFAFHHFLDPLAALREMRRVCRPGGRVLVCDLAPAAEKAAAFNEAEVLRDPSHTRALSIEEQRALFAAAGLPEPRVTTTRVGDALESLLKRSFPKSGGDADRLRERYRACLTDDILDVAPHLVDGQIHYRFPIAILVSTMPL
jgi:ubiquinone/menaquinone biosynthesis C-methylase UbiE